MITNKKSAQGFQGESLVLFDMLYYARARGFIRLRRLRRDETLAVSTENKFFIIFTANNTDRKN